MLVELLDELPFELGPKLFQREVFRDKRGSFEMLFQEDVIKSHFQNFPSMKQINSIWAVKGALRGFHSAESGKNHWKIVTCIVGKVLDAVMDLRESSVTFGQVRFAEIDSMYPESLVIPPGFGHAVQSLTSNSLTIYATNIEYKDNDEFAIHPVNGKWGANWIKPTILSERDSMGNNLNHFFKNKD